ncbi:MAG: plastocyanin/azurin family copper-binding protein [Gammaproteobacteria bacterium]
MQINKTFIASLAVSGLVLSGNVAAETVEVKASGMKFDPVVAFVKAGDTVIWTGLPTASHDAVAIPSMIPEGAEVFNKKEEGATVTLNKEGAYVYKCSPHLGLGMVGAIVVGDKMPANMEQIQKSSENKGPVARIVKELESQIEAKFAK